MLDKIRQFFGSQSASSEDSIRKVVPEEPWPDPPEQSQCQWFLLMQQLRLAQTLQSKTSLIQSKRTSTGNLRSIKATRL